MPVLGDYPPPELRDATLEQLAHAARGTVIDIGTSVQGRLLRVARVPSTSAGSAVPRVLCLANIHGVELIGGRVALGLLAALASEGGVFAELRARAEVLVLPCLNPDGYARTVESDGRGTLAQLRTNARGVDLNRNFPLPGGARPSRIPTTGSSKPGAATYRGAAALSEPETRALDALMQSERPHAVLSLHSFMGTLIPARVTDAGHYRAYGELCRAFAAHQPRHHYSRLASRHLDVFTGELEDHAHHVHQAWASCVEVFPVLHSVQQHLRAPSLFWRFNPHDALAYVANDAPALAAFFLCALQKPRPSGTPPE